LDDGKLDKSELEKAVDDSVITETEAEKVEETAASELERENDKGELSKDSLESGVKLGALSEERAAKLDDRAQLLKQMDDKRLDPDTIKKAFDEGAITRKQASHLMDLSEKQEIEFEKSTKQSMENRVSAEKARRLRQKQEKEAAKKKRSIDKKDTMKTLIHHFKTGKMTREELLNDVQLGLVDSKVAAGLWKAKQDVDAKPNLPGYPFSKKEILDGVATGAVDAADGLDTFLNEKKVDRLPSDNKKFTKEQLLELGERGELSEGDIQRIMKKEGIK